MVEGRMADEQLQELERRWRATGALEDEVEWVAALVRARRVSAADLELAATVGSLAARRLLPGRRWPGDRSVQAMATSLASAPRPVQVRALVALSRLVLPVWSRSHPGDLRLAAAIEASEESLSDGVLEHWLSAVDQQLFQRSGRDALQAAVEASRVVEVGTPAAHAALVCIATVAFACGPPPLRTRPALAVAAWEAQCALGERPERPLAGGEEIARALQQALVPWRRGP